MVFIGEVVFLSPLQRFIVFQSLEIYSLRPQTLKSLLLLSPSWWKSYLKKHEGGSTEHELQGEY